MINKDIIFIGGKMTDFDITGYMCKIDWDYEFGNAENGNHVYPSIEALKKYHTCWEECGIVEVEVRLKRVVVEENLFGNENGE